MSSRVRSNWSLRSARWPARGISGGRVRTPPESRAYSGSPSGAGSGRGAPRAPCCSRRTSPLTSPRRLPLLAVAIAPVAKRFGNGLPLGKPWRGGPVDVDPHLVVQGLRAQAFKADPEQGRQFLPRLLLEGALRGAVPHEPGGLLEQLGADERRGRARLRFGSESSCLTVRAHILDVCTRPTLVSWQAV